MSVTTNPAQAAKTAENRLRLFASANDSWINRHYLGQRIPLREAVFMGLTTAPAMEIMGRPDWREFAEQAGFVLLKKGVLTRMRRKAANGECVYRISDRWWKSLAAKGE